MLGRCCLGRFYGTTWFPRNRYRAPGGSSTFSSLMKTLTSWMLSWLFDYHTTLSTSPARTPSRFHPMMWYVCDLQEGALTRLWAPAFQKGSVSHVLRVSITSAPLKEPTCAPYSPQGCSQKRYCRALFSHPGGLLIVAVEPDFVLNTLDRS